MTKRAFDLFVAVALLLVAAPIMACAALVILVVDGTPILFRQTRVGRGGALFTLMKLRTMRPCSQGLGITVAGDERVTPLGAWLRKWRLDELPQLLNVLRGDMSMVGYRPELPQYVAANLESYRSLFEYRPGVTDPATIALTDESELLRWQDDPEAYYVHKLLPEKIRVSQGYAQSSSIGSDLGVLAATCIAILRHGKGK